MCNEISKYKQFIDYLDNFIKCRLLKIQSSFNHKRGKLNYFDIVIQISGKYLSKNQIDEIGFVTNDPKNQFILYKSGTSTKIYSRIDSDNRVTIEAVLITYLCNQNLNNDNDSKNIQNLPKFKYSYIILKNGLMKTSRKGISEINNKVKKLKL